MNKLQAWFQTHKKESAIGGAALAILVLVYLYIRGKQNQAAQTAAQAAQASVPVSGGSNSVSNTNYTTTINGMPTSGSTNPQPGSGLASGEVRPQYSLKVADPSVQAGINKFDQNAGGVPAYNQAGQQQSIVPWNTPISYNPNPQEDTNVTNLYKGEPTQFYDAQNPNTGQDYGLIDIVDILSQNGGSGSNSGGFQATPQIGQQIAA